ncbi:MAG: IS110 family transposase [Alphaproteobacteria bacterium]|nr:IS110 family transposase [Alphaproteobacteria bacterium]
MGSYIGIDVSKARLDVCVWPANELRTFDNSPSGVATFIRFARKVSPELIVFEHTGRLSRDLIEHLADYEIPTALVDPRKVRALATVIGREAKTDALDAQLIARFASLIRPASSRSTTAAEYELRDLVTRRMQLVGERRREAIRRTQLQGDFCLQGIERHLRWLEAEIALTDGEIDNRISDHDEWRRLREIVTSMPGFGNTAAHTLIAHLPELGHHNSKRISGLLGLAPRDRESGKISRYKKTGYGRVQVRAVLFMCSVVATQHNPVIRRFHKRLIEAGKPRLVARVAVMRKMLTILN